MVLDRVDEGRGGAQSRGEEEHVLLHGDMILPFRLVGERRTKLIDGIVLSKFDTIDDKVGAALSMVYTSGAPVVFVGCGQTYTDLRRLNVKSVVKILLSSK